MPSNSLNVILCGETGVGKSSVINLMAGRPVAKVSPDADPCTTNSKDYQFTIGSRRVTVWDTVDLEERRMRVGYCVAIVKAYDLIQKVSKAGGVDLLLFCICKNNITATTQRNYRLFYEALCDKQVPIALIITHLERERRMEDWWTRNEVSILKYGFKCTGHACVTGTTDREDKFRESREAIHHLLSQHGSQGRFTMPPNSWIIRLLEHPASLVSPNSSSRKDVARTLTKRCGLGKETAQSLAARLCYGNQQ